MVTHSIMSSYALETFSNSRILGDLSTKLFKRKLDFNLAVFKRWQFSVVLHALSKNAVFCEGFKYTGKQICIDMLLTHSSRLI